MSVVTRRLLLALAGIPVVLGLVRLRLEVDVLELLPRGLPEVEGLRWHQRHFSAAQDLWITLSADNPEAVEQTTRRLVDGLRARPELVRRVVAGDPFSGAPGEWAPLLAWMWLNQPEAEIDLLASRLDPEGAAAALEEARETLSGAFSGGDLVRAATDPFGLTRVGSGLGRPTGDPFRSPDGTFQVIEIQPAADLGSYPATVRWLERMREAVGRDLGEVDGLRVRYTGGPAFTAEIAGGMERDLTRSAAGTLAVVAALFWLAHRTWRPLIRLLLLLLATLVLTLAAAGLAGAALNVVSLGFAAILLGLVVDYGLVTWHERRGHPGADAGWVRRRVGGPVGWSAVTTAGAFAVVMAAGLPGLRQLGGLVAFGVLAGAVLMVRGFARARAAGPGVAVPPADDSGAGPGGIPEPDRRRWTAWGVAAGVALGALMILVNRGWPGVDASSEPLRPRGSEAHAAMEEWGRRIGRGSGSLWLLVPGASASDVARRLERIDAMLAGARDAGDVRSYRLPGPLWPDPVRQMANRARLAAMAGRLPALEQAAAEAGFTDEALRLTRQVLGRWGEFPAAGDIGDPVPMPASDAASWLVGQMVGRGPDGWVALGMVETGVGVDPARLAAGLAGAGGWLTAWDRLGPALLERVEGRLPWLAAAAALLVLGALGMAFRSVSAVLVSLAGLGLAALVFLAAMSLAGFHWNLMSLVALPLALGLGVDYSIHVLFAVRRGEGHGVVFRRGVGGALLLCAATTVTGFASLGLSSNAGLASLGWTCAGAVGCVLVLSLVWLPAVAPVGNAEGGSGRVSGPSGWYRAGLWRAGMTLARLLPRCLLVGLARGVARVAGWMDAGRRRVVEANLLPCCGDGDAARRAAGRLYANFGRKLVDLWRDEAGVSDAVRVRPGRGWEHFRAARDTGRGVLLVTPHLGNWEAGTRLLIGLGERPLVVTAREPGAGFTELREAARARAGTRTVVVGDDPFAFVPVVRHLQDGGLVALLVDRPAAAAAVEVELLGRPIRAAISPAEMARATGCVVLPVAIVWAGDAYEAEVLAPVEYDRAELAGRAGRVVLTGRILRAFEPVLREHPDQWYHFVPVWS